MCYKSSSSDLKNKWNEIKQWKSKSPVHHKEENEIKDKIENLNLDF